MKEDRRSLLKNSIIPSMVDSIVLWSYMISLWKITNRLSELTEPSTVICPSDILQRHVHCIFSVFTDGATSNNLFQYCLFIYFLVKFGFWTKSMLSKCCFHFIQQSKVDSHGRTPRPSLLMSSSVWKNYGLSIIQSGREVYLAVGLNQSAAIPGGAPRLHQSELQHCRQTDWPKNSSGRHCVWVSLNRK